MKKRKKKERTLTHLKMEDCKTISESNVAHDWAVWTQCLLWDYSNNKLWTSPEKLKNRRKEIWSVGGKEELRTEQEKLFFSGGDKYCSKMNGMLYRLVLIITSLVDVTVWWRGVRRRTDLFFWGMIWKHIVVLYCEDDVLRKWMAVTYHLSLLSHP